MKGATIGGEPITITGGTEAERIRVQLVSPGLLTLLGVKPSIGRSFTSEDAPYDAETAIVISHGLWQRRFGGSAAVLGQTVTMQNAVHTIIGVMPPGFWIFPWDGNVDAWRALNLTHNRLTPDTRWLSVQARLKPGTTLEQTRSKAGETASTLPNPVAPGIKSPGHSRSAAGRTLPSLPRRDVHHRAIGLCPDPQSEFQDGTCTGHFLAPTLSSCSNM